MSLCYVSHHTAHVRSDCSSWDCSSFRASPKHRYTSTPCWGDPLCLRCFPSSPSSHFLLMPEPSCDVSCPTTPALISCPDLNPEQSNTYSPQAVHIPDLANVVHYEMKVHLQQSMGSLISWTDAHSVLNLHAYPSTWHTTDTMTCRRWMNEQINGWMRRVLTSFSESFATDSPDVALRKPDPLKSYSYSIDSDLQ